MLWSWLAASSGAKNRVHFSHDDFSLPHRRMRKTGSTFSHDDFSLPHRRMRKTGSTFSHDALIVPRLAPTVFETVENGTAADRKGVLKNQLAIARETF